MESSKVVVIDTETELIGPNSVVPRLICASFCHDGEEPYVLSTSDEELEPLLRRLLQPGGPLLVMHNAAFDVPVLYNAYPALQALIWAKLQEGKVSDTMLREQLLNLGTHGNLESFTMPNGTVKRISYSLAALVESYLDVDISSAKEGDDAWRKSYSLLDGLKAAQYPQSAYEYAADDAGYTFGVFVKQEAKAETPAALGNLEVAKFQTAVACSLAFITERGMGTDPVALARLKKFLDHELSDENMAPLIQAGVMTPALPAMPYKTKETLARETIGEWLGILPEDVDFQLLDDGLRTSLEETGVKFKKATKSSIKQAELKRHLVAAAVARAGKGSVPELLKAASTLAAMGDLADERGGELTRTDTDQGSAAAAVVQELSSLSPVLKTFEDRQKLQKLVSTEIPRMMWNGQLAPTVHFPYKTILETGRTSSHASKFYPSANGQNVDPRARNVYVPRPGYVLASVDYSALELVCVAQTTYDMFGHSVHRDKIIGGYDLHAYLGTKLALELGSPEFLAMVKERGTDILNMDACYAVFLDMKNEHPKVFKYWRKLAKPVGLGFPGGLGAATLVQFATATYGVDMEGIAAERYETNPDSFDLSDVEFYAKKMKVDLEWSPVLLAIALAVQFRKIWLTTYPEMEEYFKTIRNFNDPSGDLKIYDGNKRLAYEASVQAWEEAGRPAGDEPDPSDFGGSRLLCYDTPMGMRRARCTYTSLSNGLCMQSPGAEGAKHAIIKTVQACKDPASTSILKGKAHVVNFVHDELLVELTADGTEHEQAMEVVRLMELGLQEVIRDVPVKAEPALMLRWDKGAEPVFENGRLVPWTSN